MSLLHPDGRLGMKLGEQGRGKGGYVHVVADVQGLEMVSEECTSKLVYWHQRMIRI
jgi:hypothetical protein